MSGAGEKLGNAPNGDDIGRTAAFGNEGRVDGTVLCHRTSEATWVGLGLARGVMSRGSIWN